MPKLNNRVANRIFIKTYLLGIVLGLLTSSLVAFAAFSPNSLLTADSLNNEFAKIQPLGVGQSWVNMSDSANPTGEVRVPGRAYLNDTGRPIQVSYTIIGSAGASLLVSPSVNGTFVIIARGSNSNSAGDAANLSAVIPPDYWYQTTDNAGFSYIWYELRAVP